MDRNPSARQEAQGRPCVVIEWDDDGSFTVHADPDVEVFNHYSDPDVDTLYRYTPLPIGKGWLDQPALDLGDQEDDVV